MANAHSAVANLDFARLTVHLIPTSLDVIHGVNDDEAIRTEVSLHGGEQGSSRRFLGSSICARAILAIGISASGQQWRDQTRN